MNQVLDWLVKAAKNWKTTLSGICMTILGFSAAFSAPNPYIDTRITHIALVVTAVATLILHGGMTDGNQQTINLPEGTAVKMPIPAGADVQQVTTIKVPEKP